MTTTEKPPAAPGALGGDAILFLTALIWGFAFVAQRVGMDHLGPFAFNAARYLLGAVSLVPVYLLFRARRGASAAIAGTAASPSSQAPAKTSPLSTALGASLIMGLVLFMGASLQQLGLVTTTAGKASFITSLYVILVPFIGSLFGRRVGAMDWLASLVAVAGLWLITMGAGLTISQGDLYELVGALFWAIHIIVIGRFATRYDPILLSIGQFTVAGLLSLLVSLFTETTSVAGLSASLVPILYGGLASCGIAYTLQIFGQRTARPSHASIILALEGLFGAVGGILILGEPATARILGGGALMIAAAILPQVLLVRGRAALKSRAATPPGAPVEGGKAP